MGVARTHTRLAVLVLILPLLLCGCADPLAECNPYEAYDDALSGAVYERGSMLDPDEIRELRLYSFDVHLGLPCPPKKKFMHKLQTIRESDEIAEYLEAINRTNSVACDFKPVPPFSTAIGLEFVAVDNRKTFITIQIFCNELCEFPFPQKKLAYNQWCFCNRALHDLLKEKNILDARPGYAEFMAARCGAP